jgi:GT2 family glycosyltransferase
MRSSETRLGPTVSVVMPTFRRPTTLRSTLLRLLQIDYPATAYEIIVVDDGSQDETAEVVRGLAGDRVEVTYLSQSNRGAAAARNRGAEAASGDLLVFCDDDMLVERSHLALHVQTRDAHGDCAVNGEWWFSPKVEEMLARTAFGRFRLDLAREFQRLDGVALDDTCVEAPTLSACDLGIRRELFVELGGFDADVPYAGAEDQELSLRMRRSGCMLVRNRAIRTAHADVILTLSQFCSREERSACTLGVLAAKHPGAFGHREIVVENGPVRAADRPTLIVKKLAKRALSAPAPLAFLHAIVDALERRGVGERRLRRAYTGLLALHIFRGVRQGLTSRRRGQPLSPAAEDVEPDQRPVEAE